MTHNDNLQPLINDATRRFVAAHRLDDVRRLALCGCGDGAVDLPFALDQIAGWQTARTKLPSWAATDGLVYPPRLSMEQCSGERAALYKAAVARRLTGGVPATVCDLTGGFGVDFAFMVRAVGRAAGEGSVYIEQNALLSRAAASNLPLLALAGAEVVCGDSAAYLASCGSFDIIFADPARRDAAGGRTFAIADCTPDVASLMPLMLSRSRHVIVKLSPMLDWRKAVADLGGRVSEVHIVSVDGECKDLLVVLRGAGSPAPADGVAVSAVRISGGATTVFPFRWHRGAAEPLPECLEPSAALSAAGGVLCVPDASLMKAGCFAALCSAFRLRQAAPNSHLFVASEQPAGFPGRTFRIVAAGTMNRKELRRILAGVGRANVAVRNFPLTADELRRRLKLKDGGPTSVFATTLSDATHAVFVCEAL